jgi:hypothetical protein
VYDEEGKKVIASFPKTDYAPRLDQEPQMSLGNLTLPNGLTIPVCSPQKFKELEGLPPYESPEKCPDIIVSMLVGQKLQETGQWPGAVFGPDTNKGAVRSDKGQIIGTKCLIQYCARRALPHMKREGQ